MNHDAQENDVTKRDTPLSKCLYCVSECTREATTQCWRGRACLEDGPGHCCEVRETIGDRHLSIKPCGRSYCPYYILVTEDHAICSCPTRNEFVRRWGV